MAVRVWNQTIDPNANLAGTLTCIARIVDDPMHLVAVSAAHVLAPLVETDALGPQEGDEIVFELPDQQRLTGRLWFWCELQRKTDGFSNKFDTALVDISESDAATLLKAIEQPSTRSAPSAELMVQFNGVTSGVTEGIFIDLKSVEPVMYSTLGGGYATVVFTDCLGARLKAQSGDSGALVVCNSSAVGLLVASDGEMSTVLSLDKLFESFNLEWISLSTLDSSGLVPVRVELPASVVLDQDTAIDTMARTLWGEARGEPLQGILAVAAVILNRAMHPHVHWWGTTVVGVCRARKQFSCWNSTDPNLPKLLAVTLDNDRFRICWRVAQDAMGGKLQDLCKLGATHYHTKSISPSWAERKVPCADIGNHLFYNNID